MVSLRGQKGTKKSEEDDDVDLYSPVALVCPLDTAGIYTLSNLFLNSC